MGSLCLLEEMRYGAACMAMQALCSEWQARGHAAQGPLEMSLQEMQLHDRLVEGKGGGIQNCGPPAGSLAVMSLL